MHVAVKLVPICSTGDCGTIIKWELLTANQQNKRENYSFYSTSVSFNLKKKKHAYISNRFFFFFFLCSAVTTEPANEPKFIKKLKRWIKAEAVNKSQHDHQWWWVDDLRLFNLLVDNLPQTLYVCMINAKYKQTTSSVSLSSSLFIHIKLLEAVWWMFLWKWNYNRGTEEHVFN